MLISILDNMTSSMLNGLHIKISGFASSQEKFNDFDPYEYQGFAKGGFAILPHFRGLKIRMRGITTPFENMAILWG